jgi:NTE family protein
MAVTNPEYKLNYDKFADPFMYSGIPYLAQDLQSKKLDIRGACFTGGGAKGVVYAGMLQALEEKNVLKNLVRLGGSSAGAITAVLVGTLAGLQVDQLRKERLKVLDTIIKETDFGMFFDQYTIDKNLKPNYQNLYNPLGFKKTKLGLTGAIFVSPIAVPLGFTTEFLKGIFRGGEKLYGGVESLHTLRTKGGVYSGETFLWWMRNTMNEFLGLKPYDDSSEAVKRRTTVTFAQFLDLTGVNLTITATKINDRTTKYFSAEFTPHVEVALAVRASMSLPGIFQEVQIQEYNNETGAVVMKGGKPLVNSYIDGGVYDNYPLNSFDVFDKQGEATAWDTKTIGFLLKGRNDATGEYIESDEVNTGTRIGTLSALHNVLHKSRRTGSPFWLRTCFLDIFADKAEINGLLTSGGLPLLGREDQLKVNTDNGLIIGTTEFTLPKYKTDIMVQKGYVQTMEFLTWIESRMIKVKKGFTHKDFLFTPKYRERIITDKLGTHIAESCTKLSPSDQVCTKIADAGKVLTDMYHNFFTEASEIHSNPLFRELDLPIENDVYEGLDITNEKTKLAAHGRLNDLQKILEEMWISVDSSGKTVEDKIKRITMLQTELDVTTVEKDIALKTAELNKLLVDDVLLNFNYLLINFRSLAQKVGTSPEFSPKFALISEESLKVNFTPERLDKYDLALNPEQQQRLNANSPKKANLAQTKSLAALDLPSTKVPVSRKTVEF